MKKETLRLDHVTLKEDATTLLDNMNLHIFEGEILGLIGMDSYGREALLQLLEKNIPLHYGYVYFRETLVNSYKYSPMSNNRIATIEERSQLVETLTVADNLFVLRKGFKQYVIRPKMLEEQLERLTKEIDVEIDARSQVLNLSRFERCVIELIKAVSMSVKLIVLRDISNFISAADLVKLKEIVRYYAGQGVSFLYICHHHTDAFTVCDRVVLMEGGKIIKVLGREQFCADIIPNFTLDFSRRPILGVQDSGSGGLWQFQHVATENIRDMSFSVKKGECVVFQDINNTALEDLLALMSGDLTPKSGRILIKGKERGKKTSDFSKKISFILANPTKTLICSEMTYLDNLCFLLDQKYPALWMFNRVRRSIQQEYYELVGADIEKNDITKLSQKSLYSLVYYRVHLYRPEIVFIVQPFAHADMYLRHHIIHLIRKLRERQITVVILAVNLADCLVIANRLFTIKQGELSMEICSSEFSEL